VPSTSKSAFGRRFMGTRPNQWRGPDAKGKLKSLAVTEERARFGLVMPNPMPVAVAPEITESDVRRACFDLVQGGLPDPRLSTVGRSERRRPMERRFDILGDTRRFLLHHAEGSRRRADRRESVPP